MNSQNIMVSGPKSREGLCTPPWWPSFLLPLISLGWWAVSWLAYYILGSSVSLCQGLFRLMLLLGILFLLTSDASVSLDSLDLGDLTCCFLLGGVLKPDAYKRPEVTAKPHSCCYYSHPCCQCSEAGSGSKTLPMWEACFEQIDLFADGQTLPKRRTSYLSVNVLPAPKGTEKTWATWPLCWVTYLWRRLWELVA